MTETKTEDTTAPAHRQLTLGSMQECAEWLLGIADMDPEGAEDFGALSGMAFAGGTLMRCGPDMIWRPLPESEAYGLIKRFDGARYVNPEGKQRNLLMSAELSRRVYRVLELECHQPEFFKAAPAGLAFENGFLRIAPDGGSRLEPLTPEHHATRLLPWVYEPIPEPRSFESWKAFLWSVWGSSGTSGGPDHEAIALVHQMIGYLLSGSNDLQKAFLFLGPPRSGKGTILKLLFRLFGPAAGAFKLNDLDQQFSLAGMVGKSVLIDGDVRRSRCMGRDEGKIVERGLGITSGDVQDIPRKNREHLHVALPGRLVMASNPPFSLRDVGGAFASRLVVVPFPVSYLGQEDPTLEARLARELPAIVALAMQSMRALRAQGRFAELESTRELRAEIQRGQSPLLEFVEDWCELDDTATTDRQDLYAAVREWSTLNGTGCPSLASVTGALHQMGVQTVRPRDEGGARDARRSRAYRGIRLLNTAAKAGGVAGLQRPKNGMADVLPLRPVRAP